MKQASPIRNPARFTAGWLEVAAGNNVYALSRGEGESDRNELCGPLAGKGKGSTQKGHLSRAHSEVGRREGGKE